MNESSPDLPTSVSLDALLQRDDIMWMGHSQRFATREAVATGYEVLNERLLNKGWPLGSLIEVCQQGMQGEWQLFSSALLELPGLIVLLNPPAAPFAQAFIQAGIDLEKLIVVETKNRHEFVSSFVEVARASVGSLLAWQPAVLNYTELRKCSLAAADGQGLSIVFRHSAAQQQSSPASLRLFAHQVATGLEITIFKQKGYLQTQQAHPILLPIPLSRTAMPAHSELNKNAHTRQQTHPPSKVTPIRGKS
jgi:protein ImuA